MQRDGWGAGPRVMQSGPARACPEVHPAPTHFAVRGGRGRAGQRGEAGNDRGRLLMEELMEVGRPAWMFLPIAYEQYALPGLALLPQVRLRLYPRACCRLATFVCQLFPTSPTSPTSTAQYCAVPKMPNVTMKAQRAASRILATTARRNTSLARFAGFAGPGNTVHHMHTTQMSGQGACARST